MISRVTGTLSAKMANMSFVCACLVVLLHCSPAAAPGCFAWWFCHMFGREGLCIIAVPYFFFAAGFFLAGKFDGSRPTLDVWRQEVKKRARSLLLPFVIWMVISAVRSYLMWYAKIRIFHVSAEAGFWTHSVAWQMLLFSGLHPFADIGIFWFIRCLFALVVISPILVWLTRYKWLVLTMLIAGYGAFLYFDGNGAGWDFYFFFDRYVTIRGLLWFFIGITCRVADWKFSDDWLRGGLLIVIGIVFLICKNILDLNGRGAAMNIVEAMAVPFLMIGVFSIVPVRRLSSRLVDNSFPIFLAHNAFLSLAAMLLMFFKISGNAEWAVIVMLFRLCIAVSLSVLLAEWLKRSFPRFANIVYGGR